jgi:50S ribosomal subunit-associated GTPase HflX
VIDASEDAAERFAAINRELEHYGAGLESLPQVVVLNKVDLLSEAPAFDVEDARILASYELSAATGAGVDRFKRRLFEHVPPVARPVESDSELVDFLVYRPRPRRERNYRILRTDRGFRIEGTPPDEVELEQALRAAGARKGSEVEVGEETFELA